MCELCVCELCVCELCVCECCCVAGGGWRDREVQCVKGWSVHPPPPTHALNSTGRTEANFVRGWGSLPHNTHFDWQDRTPKEDREANIAGVMSWHVVIA